MSILAIKTDVWNNLRWPHLWVETFNSTFLVQIELWWAIFSTKCAFPFFFFFRPSPSSASPRLWYNRWQVWTLCSEQFPVQGAPENFVILLFYVWPYWGPSSNIQNLKNVSREGLFIMPHMELLSASQKKQLSQHFIFSDAVKMHEFHLGGNTFWANFFFS